MDTEFLNDLFQNIMLESSETVIIRKMHSRYACVAA